MKVISWNCNMAFRKKFERICKYKPDLLVLQECEHQEKLLEFIDSPEIHQVLWYGNNVHKGVCIITFGKTTVELQRDYNLEFEHIIPLTLKSDNGNVNLFCVWAMPHKTDRAKDYVGQIWGAANYYKKLLKSKSMIIGDLNSNTIWDKKKRVGNHSDLVKLLNENNMFSVYHELNSIEHGQETDPTFFLTKKQEKPYHLDYCFVSKDLMTDKTKIRIGRFNDWIKLSDHMPVIIEYLDINTNSV